MDPVSSLIGTISHFFDYMNPSRSPYMLGVIVAAVVLFLFKDSTDAGSYISELMFLVPVFLATAFFVVLSLRFRDRLLAAVSDRNDLKIELNGQFRFARAVAVSCSIVAFYMIWNSGVSYSGVANIIAYLLVVAHLATFLLYSFLYNNRLHFSRRRSVLQVSIIMSVVMLVVVHASAKIGTSDGSFWTSCIATYTVDVEAAGGDVSRQIAGDDDSFPIRSSLRTTCVPAQLEQLRAENEDIVSIVSASVTSDLDGSAVMFVAYSGIWLVYAAFWAILLRALVQASRRARRGAINALLGRAGTSP